MRGKVKKQNICVWAVVLCVFLSGCIKLEINEEGQPAEYQILEERDIPEEMNCRIEQIKTEPFQITFEDEKNLYIGQGYGKKDMEGYEIEVDRCEESAHFIFVHMNLYGPRNRGEEQDSWPYTVIALDKKGKQVIFMNELGGI